MSFLTQALGSLKQGLSAGASPGAISMATGPAGAAVKQRAHLPEYTCIIICEELGIEVVAQLPEEFTFGTSAAYDTPLRDALNSVVNTIPMSNALQGIARVAGMSLVSQTTSAKVWSGSSSSDISLNLILHANQDEVDEVLDPLIQLMALTLPHLAGGTNGSILAAPGPFLDIVGAAAQTATGGWNAVKDLGTVGGQASVKNLAGKASKSLSGLFGGLVDPTAKGVSAKLLNSSVTALGEGVDLGVSSINKVLGSVDGLVRDKVHNRISLKIGNYMFFPSVVLKDVQQTHHVLPVGKSFGYSSGNMARVEVQLTFEPYFDLTLNDLKDIFVDKRAQEIVKKILQKHSVKTSKR